MKSNFHFWVNYNFMAINFMLIFTMMITAQPCLKSAFSVCFPRQNLSFWFDRKEVMQRQHSKW